MKKAKDYVESPKRVVKESKAPKRFCSYMALVSRINESKPSTYEEAADQQVWRDAMVEKYNSITKNSVGGCSKTYGEVNGDFQVVLQNQTCCGW